jgi:hypothetical protein
MFDNTNFPNLTKDGHGFVYWRGFQVEHYSFGWGLENQQREQEAAEELAAYCEHLDKIGVPVVGGMWFSDWFKPMTAKSAYKNLLAMKPGFYEDGENLIIHVRSGYFLVNKGHVMRVELGEEPEKGESDFHVLDKYGFTIADAGQGKRLGVCYSTYQGVSTMLKRHNVAENLTL